jgi:hypothetical protein
MPGSWLDARVEYAAALGILCFAAGIVHDLLSVLPRAAFDLGREGLAALGSRCDTIQSLTSFCV